MTTGPGDGVVAPGPRGFGEGPGPACVGTLTLGAMWAVGAAGGVATGVFWQYGIRDGLSARSCRLKIKAM